MGPEGPDETLHQSPATRYLVGMLAPRGTAVSPSEDEHDDGDGNDTAGPSEGRHNVSQSLAPSSIGLSFIVGNDVELVDAVATWGEYEKVERAGDEVDPTESTDIDPDGDPEESARSRRKEYDWARTPIRISTQVRLDESRSLEIADGATLEWFVEHIADRTVVSIFLVNTRQAPPGKRPPDEAWMYQPQLTVTGGDAVFEPRRLPRDRPDSDADIASADLIYRNRREFAVGHGVAADWNLETADAERATEIRTSVIPTQEVFGATGPTGVPSPSMDALAEAASPNQVAAVVEPMLEAYETWIEEREVEADTVLPPDRTVAVEHVQAQRRSLERMRAGLTAIAEDEDAFYGRSSSRIVRWRCSDVLRSEFCESDVARNHWTIVRSSPSGDPSSLDSSFRQSRAWSTRTGTIEKSQTCSGTQPEVARPKPISGSPRSHSLFDGAGGLAMDTTLAAGPRSSCGIRSGF